MSPSEVRKAIIGRTIVDAQPHTSLEGEVPGLRRQMHDWELTLDNGRVVRFLVEEHPDGADYGVDIVLVRMRSDRKGRKGQ